MGSHAFFRTDRRQIKRERPSQISKDGRLFAPETSAGRHTVRLSLQHAQKKMPESLRGRHVRAKLLGMSNLALHIRKARLDDAADVAQVYIDSWHDTYPGVLPGTLLRAMTPRGQTARWQTAIRAVGRETVLVADSCHGIVGMASIGASRDRALGFDGEVYTLYVDPAYLGIGIGKALLKSAFVELRKNGMTSCVIWSHAKNNARFFCEAMGGRLVAERTTRLMGEPCPETAFGWKVLAVAERTAAK